MVGDDMGGDLASGSGATDAPMRGHDASTSGVAETRSASDARVAAFRPRRRTLRRDIETGPLTPEALRRDAAYRRMLALSDVAAATLAVSLGVLVTGHDRLRVAAILAFPLVVLLGKALGLYDRDEARVRKTTLDEAPYLFQVATLYTMLLWLGQEFLFVGEIGRHQVIALWGLLFVFAVAGRAVARRLVKRRVGPERCVVLGNAAAARELRKKFRASYTSKAGVIGRVKLDSTVEPQSPALGTPPLLGTVDDLPALIGKHNVERVIIAPGTADCEELLGVIRIVKAMGTKVSILPRLFEVVGSAVEFDEIDGLVLLGLRREGLNRSSAAMKRAMDVVVAIVALVLLAPLLILAAIAIKTTSKGPVFFKQKRIGREGREFQMIKFRTMIDGADKLRDELRTLSVAEDGLFKIPDDPRFIRVGRFLRRTYVDELPQLFNVLRGEMSVVGPRPLVPDEDCLVSGWERRRLHVSPGMTGVWQILGPARVPLSEMVKLDYLYGSHWSLWLDVKILLRTIPHVVSRRGL